MEAGQEATGRAVVMIGNGFEIHARLFISRATCKKCHNYCEEVADGLVGTALYCPACEIFYQLKMVKLPDKMVNLEYLNKCRAKYPKKEKH